MDPMTIMTLLGAGMNLYNGLAGNMQQNRLQAQAMAAANNYLSMTDAMNQAREVVNPEFSARLAEANHGVDQQMLSRGMYGQAAHATGLGETAAANERARLSALAQLGGQIQSNSMQSAAQRASALMQGAGLAGNRASTGMQGLTSMGNNWMDKNSNGLMGVFDDFKTMLKGGGYVSNYNGPAGKKIGALQI